MIRPTYWTAGPLMSTRKRLVRPWILCRTVPISVRSSAATFRRWRRWGI
uniref:Uncharacterized protein n=1 Tax=Myoviridae sp. ctu2j3 TaxID=2825197 RepID=A0A8S5UIS6_9CAUD|nr:MAG TPA: hypothetical protein [Myoviridae sp. ctu2j3]DAF94332.1 MAG TPA: hypothetical protein [Myoviridae sp. ctu2j3]